MSFITCTVLYSNDEVKEDEMGGVCSTNGEEVEFI
jgi:hypothetical protein